MPKNHITASDAQIIANATGYIVSCFRGRGQFDKSEHTDLEAARTAGKQLAQLVHRPVALYAVQAGATGFRQAHMENIEP